MLVDANILIYAVHKASPQHRQARAWLDMSLGGVCRVGLPWISLLAFLRISSNPRVFTSPMSVRDGWRQIERWMSAKSAWQPEPTTQHAQVMADLVNSISLTANDVPDAHLAALAIEHGLVLCSSDADFAKYPGLRWENPLRNQ